MLRHCDDNVFRLLKVAVAEKETSFASFVHDNDGILLSTNRMKLLESELSQWN